MTIKIGDAWPFEAVRGFTGAPLPKPVWHALITAPQRESATARKLGAIGVDVQYPTIAKTRHIRGKRQEYIIPFISQIIYAKFRYAPNWDVMRDRRLITGVFSSGAEPIPLSQDDISRVMGLPTEAERLETKRIEAERPKVGDKAEIISGPLAGFFVDITKVEFGRVWFSSISGLKGDADQGMIRRLAK